MSVVQFESSWWPYLGRVFTTNNGKGGVGKTSVTANVAARRAVRIAPDGGRVLIVDLDHQGDIGDDLGYAMKGLGDGGRLLTMAVQGYVSLADARAEAVAKAEAGEDPQPGKDGFLLDVRPGLDVITGGQVLKELDWVLTGRISNREDIRLLLAVALLPIAHLYDAIFIDTPPSNERIQLLALAASRWVIIPTQADTSSHKNIREVAALLAEAREVNPWVQVAGIVLFDISSNATAIISDTQKDIAVLTAGTDIPIFSKTISTSTKVARDARDLGMLPAELPGEPAANIAAAYNTITAELFATVVTAEQAAEEVGSDG